MLTFPPHFLEDVFTEQKEITNNLIRLKMQLLITIGPLL